MPDWSHEIRERLAGLKVDPAREQSIVEEIGQHLDDRYAELLAQGSAPETALRSALDELAGPALAAALAEAVPRPSASLLPPAEDGPGARRLSGLFQDLRYGARRLRLEPLFALVAILSLALGIGANTAIFQLLDAVRLRRLPIERPEELYNVRITPGVSRSGNFSGNWPQLTSALWERIRSEQQAFSKLAVWSSDRVNLASGGEARFANVLWVSGTFFDTVGVRPLHGRVLGPSDDAPGCPTPAVVLSESFWRRELGGRPISPGDMLRIEGRPFEIAGVTPRSFFGMEVGLSFDVALPTCAEDLLAEKPRTKRRSAWWLAALGRLAPGWTPEKAQTHLAAISKGIFESTLPEDYDATRVKNYLSFQLIARPASTGFSDLREDYSDPLWLLLGISALVLLIACANIANLMVARASARQREIAVRLALGASRRRLIRQLLAESFVLAAAGAACGVALAQALSRLLVSYLSTEQARLFVDMPRDLRLLGFTAGLAVLTCVGFGLLPALHASRTDPLEALKSGGRGIAGSGARLSVRRALVVCQVALSLVLLVGALLFVRSLRQPCHARRRVPARPHPHRRRGHHAPASARWSAGPHSIMSSSSASARFRASPTRPARASSPSATPPGTKRSASKAPKSRPRARISTEWARATSARWGRRCSRGGTSTTATAPARPPSPSSPKRSPGNFSPAETRSAAPSGWRTRAATPSSVSRSSASRATASTRSCARISRRSCILSDAQDAQPGHWTNVVVRSELPLSSLRPSLTSAIAGVSPEISVTYRPFRDILRDGLLRERLMAGLSAFFGFLASILAMVGLYGVVSFMVLRRRNEIGVRMALGATRQDILVARAARGRDVARDRARDRHRPRHRRGEPRAIAPLRPRAERSRDDRPRRARSRGRGRRREPAARAPRRHARSGHGVTGGVGRAGAPAMGANS